MMLFRIHKCCDVWGQTLQRNREREVFSRPNKHSHCCRILVIFHHVVTGITDFPRIHKTFLIVWTKSPAILPLMTDPFIPFFNLDTALLGLSNFILAAKTPIKKEEVSVFLVFPLHKKSMVPWSFLVPLIGGRYHTTYILPIG